MIEMKRRLAKLLLEKSYREGEFTLSSGQKTTYYFDCRQSALHPEGAWLIGNLFAGMVRDIPATAVCGMTLGADPLVTATSIAALQQGRFLAGLLVRKEPKGHGARQYIEGLANVAKGDRVIVLEDVVTSGSSVLKACQRAQEAGLTIAAVCAILDREEGGCNALNAAGFELQSLFTRSQLVALGNS
ncbi:MAG: orotate phosphoribosyltransferase [Deltaproteobacteria bacterium]|jgi:orotate phosphoribosyltransferase|nr:orotate phosphoribosyltransferase [Deltaproteobacteria bacterium]